MSREDKLGKFTFSEEERESTPQEMEGMQDKQLPIRGLDGEHMFSDRKAMRCCLVVNDDIPTSGSSRDD